MPWKCVSYFNISVPKIHGMILNNMFYVIVIVPTVCSLDVWCHLSEDTYSAGGKLFSCPCCSFTQFQSGHPCPSTVKSCYSSSCRSTREDESYYFFLFWRCVTSDKSWSPWAWRHSWPYCTITALKYRHSSACCSITVCKSCRKVTPVLLDTRMNSSNYFLFLKGRRGGGYCFSMGYSWGRWGQCDLKIRGGHISLKSASHQVHKFFLLRHNINLGFQKCNCALCALKFYTQL